MTTFALDEDYFCPPKSTAIAYEDFRFGARTRHSSPLKMPTAPLVAEIFASPKTPSALAGQAFQGFSDRHYVGIAASTARSSDGVAPFLRL